MRTMRHTLASGLLLGLLLGGCLAWASPPWEWVTETEGMQVERRLLPGTTRYEVRVSTSAPFPPPVIFQTLWRQHEYPAFVPYLKHLTILTDSPDVKVIYEQITMPVVRDRDYTVRVTATGIPRVGRSRFPSSRRRRPGRLSRPRTSGSRPSRAAGRWSPRAVAGRWSPMSSPVIPGDAPDLARQ